MCSDLPVLNIVVSVHRGHGRRAICGQFYVLQGGAGLYCTVQLYNVHCTELYTDSTLHIVYYSLGAHVYLYFFYFDKR